MKRVLWLTELSYKDEYWLTDKVKENNVPLPIIIKYSSLHDMAEEGNVYGVLLQIKDLYESIIKIPVVMALINIKNNRENEVFTESMQADFKDLLKKLLFGSLSMGEWKSLAEFISSRRGNNRFNINETLYGILRKTSLLFEQTLSDGRSKIVTWRNETIGHGYIKCEDDEDYRQGVIDLLNLLKDYFEGHKKYSINNDYSKIFFFENDDRKLLLNIEGKILNIYPYVIAEKIGEYYFDSYYSWDKHSKYICYKNGKNRSNNELYFDNLIREYAYADAQRSLTEGKFSTNTEAEMLEALNDPGKYIRPISLLDKLKSEMESLEKGTILIQMERGTGKSAFAYAIDNLYGLSSFGKPFMEDSIVRVCRISAQQLHGINDFLSVINEDFRHRPDGTFLKNDRGYDNEQVKQLKADSVSPDADLTDILMDYQKAFVQKQWITDDGYIVLVLDGIDELIPSTEKILDFIPSSDSLPYGIFVIMTSRFSDEKTVSEWSAKCIKKAQQKADSIIAIRRDSKEIIGLLEQYIKYTRPDIPSIRNSWLIKQADYRFLYLKVFLQLYDKVKIECTDEKQVIQTHLDILKSVYTKKQQEAMKRFCLAMAVFERLSLDEYTFRYGGDELTYQLIGLVNDIIPLTTVKREKNGNYYEFADSAYNEFILDNYSDVFPEIIRAFSRSLSELFDKEQHTLIPEKELDLVNYIKSAINLWNCVKNGPYVEELLNIDQKYVSHLGFIAFRYLEDDRFNYEYIIQIKEILCRSLGEMIIELQRLHIDIKDIFNINDDSWFTPLVSTWVRSTPKYDEFKERLLKNMEVKILDRVWLPFLVFDTSDDNEDNLDNNTRDIVDHIEKAHMINDLLDYMVVYISWLYESYSSNIMNFKKSKLNNFRNELLSRKLSPADEERLFNIEAFVNLFDGKIERADYYYDKILNSGYSLFTLTGKPYRADVELKIRNHTYLKSFKTGFYDLTEADFNHLITKSTLNRDEVNAIIAFIAAEKAKLVSSFDAERLSAINNKCKMILTRIDAELITYDLDQNIVFKSEKGWIFLTLFSAVDSYLADYIEDLTDEQNEIRVIKWLHMIRTIMVERPPEVYDGVFEILFPEEMENIEQQLMNIYVNCAQNKESLKKEFEYCLHCERKEVFNNLFSQSNIGTKWFDMCYEDGNLLEFDQSLSEFETAFINMFDKKRFGDDWQLTEEGYKTILSWEKLRQPSWHDRNDKFYQLIDEKYNKLQESYEKAYESIIKSLNSDQLLEINIPLITANIEKCFVGDLYNNDEDNFNRKWNEIEKCLKKFKTKHGSEVEDIVSELTKRLMNQKDIFNNQFRCDDSGAVLLKDGLLQNIELLKDLAEQGMAEAQFLLGYYYYDSGIGHDYEKAVQWLRKAAEQGIVEAKTILDAM